MISHAASKHISYWEMLAPTDEQPLVSGGRVGKKEQEAKRKINRKTEARKSLTYRASTESETENGAGNNQGIIGAPSNLANLSSPETQCDSKRLDDNEGDGDSIRSVPCVLFEKARRK